MDTVAAAIYIRVSTEEQGQKNLSLPAQADVCQRFASDRGWRVVRRYEDRASGKTDRRKGFQDLIADASAGLFQVVIVFKYSRFARNDLDSQLYEAQLNRLGIILVSATEPIDANTSAGWLHKRILQQLVEQGGWAWHAPLGYANRQEQVGAKQVRKWVEPDPETAPLVRRAFELAA
jgi:DNA invertase Pin-like site-specific DNA recombinase